MDALKRWAPVYRVAVLAVVVAAVAAILFGKLGQPAALAFFIVAVMVSAWRSGWRPVLAATALSALMLVAFHFLQPEPPSLEATQAFLFRLGMFLIMGALAGYLSHLCTRAGDTLDHAYDVLSGFGDGLIFTNADGQVTYLNSAAETLTGWSADAGRDLPLEDVLRVTADASDGSGLPAVRPMVGLVESVRQAKGTVDLPDEAMLHSVSGQATPVEGRMAPLRDPLGRFAGVSVVFRDAARTRKRLAEVRQREQVLACMIGHAPAGLMLLDGEGRCRQANESAQQMLGCSAEECQGEGWIRHLVPEQRDRLLTELLENTCNARSHSAMFECSPPQADLVAVRWIRIQTVPMRGGDGVIGHVAWIEDLSVEKEREKEAEASKGKLTAKLDEQSTLREGAERAVEESKARFARECETLQAEFEASADQLRTAKGQLEQKARELSAEVQSLKSALNQAESDAKRQSDELAAAKKDREEAERQLEAERAETRTATHALESDLDKARQAEQDARQRLESAEAECEVSRRLSEELSTRVESFEREHRGLTARCELAEGLVEQCPTGLFSFDRECRYTAWNAAMERLTGKAKPEVLGRSAFEVFPALAEADEWEHFVQAMDGTCSVRRGTWGEQRVETTYVPLRCNDADLVGGIAAVRELAAAPEEVARSPARSPRPNVPIPEPDPAEFAAAPSREDWLAYN